MADPRNPVWVTHRLDDILRAHVLAIACGYGDADDLDALRNDPGFRLARGKLTGSGLRLASQPTMSRWENTPVEQRQELMESSCFQTGRAIRSFRPADRKFIVNPQRSIAGLPQMTFHGPFCMVF
ncbi:hypothetical protein GGR38_004784 [Novosphingobium sediminicola]|uniref:Transposase DDE domain-containing protein n=1 Tax=Novosphingobium sediminicola TaxID=563162 RepID=A0A7W6CJU4_9SPHN|nr:hypothetical protein [Novosphingobium sediminicola]